MEINMLCETFLHGIITKLYKINLSRPINE